VGPGITKEINVSIIIVNYNSFDLLNHCLESINYFTETVNYEIIVVDNNSDQNGLGKIISNYPGVRFIRNTENLGFAKANNIGLTYASGKYILFLNNDTYFIENSLKKILDFAEDIENDAFIGCRLLNKDGSNQISLVNFDNILNSFGENFFLYLLFPGNKVLNRYHYNYKKTDFPFEVDIIKGAFMFCSANAVKRLGGFDTRFFFYGEESDICMRFKKQGGKIFFYPGTSVYHVGGVTVERDQWFKFKYQNIAKIKKFQKHYKGIEFIFLIILHYIGLILRIPLYFISGLFLFNKNKLSQSFFYLRLLFVYPRNEFVN
jgi:GT2 family glycosyltransferase